VWVQEPAGAVVAAVEGHRGPHGLLAGPRPWPVVPDGLGDLAGGFGQPLGPAGEVLALSLR